MKEYSIYAYSSKFIKIAIRRDLMIFSDPTIFGNWSDRCIIFCIRKLEESCASRSIVELCRILIDSNTTLNHYFFQSKYIATSSYFASQISLKLKNETKKTKTPVTMTHAKLPFHENKILIKKKNPHQNNNNNNNW